MAYGDIKVLPSNLIVDDTAGQPTFEQKTLIADPAQSAMFDRDLDRIVAALDVKPTTGHCLIGLTRSTGEQYSLADIIEAHVALIAAAVHEHAWGDIQDGYVYCDACTARKPITDGEAVEFIWGHGRT